MRLYRYRPPTELVFKELRYSELYLASPMELNDPLDLNGQLNFFPSSSEETSALVQFLQRQAFIAHGLENGWTIHQLMTVERFAPFLMASRQPNEAGIITKDDLFHALRAFYRDCAADVPALNHLDAEVLTLVLDELFSQFLGNSAVLCFSEGPSDFLMWSHYGGCHSGICLEFEVDLEDKDPDVAHLPLLYYASLDQERVEWKADIYRVMYKSALTRLNFVHFLPVFLNAGDVDLMNLSKARWHPYAKEMQQVYLEKLETWGTEKEWRMVDVSFRSTLCEDRILNYSPRSLTGVYFGARVSEATRRRVRRIVEMHHSPARLYDCQVDGSRTLVIRENSADG